jgi:hypothetical protein
MTNRFARVLDPATPTDLAVSAVTSVQTSLFSRLRRELGAKAGIVSWCIVRAGQPDHCDHEAALATLRQLDPATLDRYAATARAALAGPRLAGVGQQAVLRAILVQLSAIAVDAADGFVMPTPAQLERLTALERAERARGASSEEIDAALAAERATWT